ncbi:MAG: hypothetical protein JST00_31795 [Deltaproteobacteria bacterium]|nr:hypothetical protein [Deltaproteobacteria bacterium]
MHAARVLAALGLPLGVGACFLLAPYPPLAEDLTNDAGSDVDAAVLTDGASREDGACTPGTTVDCWEGPREAEGKGQCARGKALCLEDGGPGPCLGSVPPAIERCETTADENCDGTGECTGGHRFALRAGDGQVQTARGVGTSPDGAIVAAGVYVGALELPPPNAALPQGGSPSVADGFVVAVDPRTSLVKWSLPLPDLALTSMVVGSSGIVIGGTTATGLSIPGCAAIPPPLPSRNDVFVAVLEHSGKCRVAKLFTGDGDKQLTAMALDDGSGDVALVGAFGGTLELPGVAALDATTPSSLQGFFARVDSKLVARRAARLAPVGTRVTITGVAVDGTGATGRSTIVGQISGGGGGATCTNVYPVPFGFGILTCDTAVAGFAITFDAGAAGVQRVWGDPGSAVQPTAVAYLGAEVAVAGVVSGTTALSGPIVTGAPPGEAFLLRTERGGALAEPAIASVFGGAGQARPRAIAVDAIGNVIVAGDYDGRPSFGGAPLPSALSANGFVAKWRVASVASEAGAARAFIHAWSFPLTSEQLVTPNAVATGALGDVVVGGSFSGSMNMGSSAPLAAAGTGTTSDAFILLRSP